MKNKLLLLVFCLSLYISSNAQEWKKEVFGTENTADNLNFFEIQKRAEVYFKDIKEEIMNSKSLFDKTEFEGNKSEKKRDWFEYKRWEMQTWHNAKSDGSIANPIEAYNEYQNFVNQNITSKETAGPTANWKNINRTSAPGGYWGMGKTSCIQFHPTDVNTFWISSESGGIWKTTNGGTSYNPIADNLPYVNVGSFCIDPKNTNIIYSCSGNYLAEGFNTSVGIYKTTDGGANWTPAGLNANLIDNKVYSTLVMSPVDSKVLLVGCVNNNATQGIYRTNDGGITWTQVFSGQRIRNIAFKMGDGNYIYACGYSKNGTENIYRSTDGGLNWSSVKTFADKGFTHAIAVSSVNTAHVAMIHADSTDYRTLYLSTDSGLNWIKKAGLGKGYVWGNVAFSPTNVTTLYVGFLNLHKSTNSGSTFGSMIAQYCCPSAGVVEVHADYQDIKINPHNKKMYFCHDGGLSIFDESVSPYGNASWVERSNGLIVSHYAGVGNSQANVNVYGGGGMDNGAWLHNAKGNWVTTLMADACLSHHFDSKDDKTSYVACYGYIVKDTTGDWSYTEKISDNIPVTQDGSWLWSEQLAVDQIDPNIIVTGTYKDVWRTKNKGKTWTKIGSDLAGGNCLRGIQIAPTNSNVMYTHFGGDLYTTTNTGTSWKKYSFSTDITGVAVSSNDPGTLWVSLHNWTAGNKVMKSTDYGVTWTNVSGNLPNIPLTFIVYDKSTDGIYVSTNLGVYYKNPLMSNWIDFGQGLPRCNVSGMAIQNNAKKLRCSTLGRGIWETDLYSNTGTGITNNSTEQAYINVYPNQNNGEFTIDMSLPNNGTYQMEIVNMLGQRVYHEQLNINNSNYNYSKKINLTAEAKGVYSLKLTGSDGKDLNKKIVIQ